MEFLEINGSAIVRERVLAVWHYQKVDEGVIYSPEHYQAIFDTGQELRLTPEEGVELVKRLAKPNQTDSGAFDSKIATTSSSTI